MSRKSKLVSISCAFALGVAGVAGGPAARAAQPELGLLAKPADRFQRAIETHALERRYRALSADARRLDATPESDPVGGEQVTSAELRQGVSELRVRVVKARQIAARSSDLGLAGGVSQSTLDAIAACESGSDPTAVDSSGTYFGKYQFDTGTWASVGGRGDPAEAPEAEQDYRASLLYSRAGSSPWPVCGV